MRLSSLFKKVTTSFRSPPRPHAEKFPACGSLNRIVPTGIPIYKCKLTSLGEKKLFPCGDRNVGYYEIEE